VISKPEEKKLAPGWAGGDLWLHSRERLPLFRDDSPLLPCGTGGGGPAWVLLFHYPCL